MDIMPRPPIPPGALGKIWEKTKKIVKYVWSIILGKDEEDIKNSKSYNPEKSDASDIVELNRLVNECRNSFGYSAKELEKEIKSQCVEMTDGILKVLERFNRNLNVYRVESIRRQLNSILDDIDGSMSEYIRQSISLDNAKCVAVLKLPAGELKGTRIKELKMEVFNEALDNICKTVRKSIDNVLYNIEDSFENKISVAEEQAEKAEKQFEVLSRASEEDRSAKEQVVMNSGFVNSLAEFAESIIVEGV